MTKIRTVHSTLQVGNTKKIIDRTCYEVGIHELEEMLSKVEQGENETTLRKELIKNSMW